MAEPIALTNCFAARNGNVGWRVAIYKEKVMGTQGWVGKLL